MKKENRCDLCGQVSDHGYSCEVCQRYFCWLGCYQQQIIFYSDSLFGGTAGIYCKECDARLEREGDLLRQLYQEVVALIREKEKWTREFTERCEQVKTAIRTIRQTKGISVI